MGRTTKYLLALNSLICGFFILHSFILGHFFTNPRSLRSDVLQGILIGIGLAFISLQLYARLKLTRVNGWVTFFDLGLPGNGFLLRAAHAQVFPGPVNVPQEAMYGWVNVDGAGHTLSGRHAYRLHFPPGGLPPNHAFWSLTMGDAGNRFVPNPLQRYSLGDRSNLASNADGSVELYIQPNAPAGHESNWLPAPAGDFILWLRVYLPAQAILDGEYLVPPVVKVS